MSERVHAVTVILPVINERDNLATLIPEIVDVLSMCNVRYEVIVADDGSTDGTAELLAQLSQSNPAIRHLDRSTLSRSLPQSILDGVTIATSEYVLWMDADGSMPPSLFPELIAAVEAEPQPVVAVGSRFVTGGGFKGVEVVGETSWLQIYRNIKNSNDSLTAVVLSRILNRFLWLALERCCRDLATGFVLARRDLVVRHGLHGSYGDYCVRFLYGIHRAGIRIIEVPFINEVRRFGESKTGNNLLDYVRRGLPYVILPFQLRLARRR
jgi:glycosyltransferase involved in cell wall biosynthesis